jgi:endonuclease III
MVSQEKVYDKTLLQELLWPNRWQCTVACLLLNVTTRKQVNQVWPTLFSEAPGPEELLELPEERLKEIIAPLGLKNQRVKRLRKLAEAWGQVPHEKLPGVGKYAWQSDRIFFHDDLLLNETVEDGALVGYLEWRRKQTWKKLS